jgi:hypothetical protein
MKEHQKGDRHQMGQTPKGAGQHKAPAKGTNELLAQEY